MGRSLGSSLREDINSGDVLPFIGVYDVFSASVAGKYYKGLFLSGFSFAASHYGLPDIGFISWSDMVAFAQRVRTILPSHHLLVDIDDGYADTEVACHVVALLESIGASGVILEDQQRPRRCGHFEGKQIMELQGFLGKLEKVLETRREMVVVARTDVSDPDEIMKRATAFEEAGADVILVDAIKDVEFIRALKKEVRRPIVFNQIAGGKSPSCTLQELRDAGVTIVLYSTPCLFAAQFAIEEAMKSLDENDGLLQSIGKTSVDLKSCTGLLTENLERRGKI